MSVTISGSDHTRPHPRVPGRFASVDLDLEDSRYVNWCNGNARVLLTLLGLVAGDREDDLYGEVPVAEARRAVLYARATLARRGPALERPEVVEHGKPRALPDGSIELHPLRLFSGGLDVQGMERRLEAFGRCVTALAEQGATHITWG